MYNELNYITHNEGYVDSCNTWLQGYIECSYQDLVNVFGEEQSTNFDNYKSDAEWDIRFQDGLVATIYNYKDGKNYCGSEGLEKVDLTEWHIGGQNSEVLDRIKQILINKGVELL